MNLLDQINLQVQQQAAHELADQLRVGYHPDSVIDRCANGLATLWHKISSRQPAPLDLNGLRWLEECQE